MVGIDGKYPHPLQGETDLPSDILALIQGCDIHIARMVVGNIRGIALVVQLEKIELDPGTEPELYALLRGFGHGILEHPPRIDGKGFAVLQRDVAEHPDHLAVLGPPGEEYRGGDIRVKEKRDQREMEGRNGNQSAVYDDDR